MKLSFTYYLSAAVIIAALFLSNSSNPPDQRTGAPGESLCSSGCHGGGSFSGMVEISGLPSTVMSGETYSITLTTTATAGSPSTGGFQIVALNSSNQNAGDMIVVFPSETGTNTSGGREYMEHRGDKGYAGGSVSWTFDWEAPAGPNNTTITFYFASVMANNNNNTTGDNVVNSNHAVTLMSPLPPVPMIDNIQHVTCFQGNNGAITASASGGSPPYNFNWSNWMNGSSISGLIAATYTLTVTDFIGLTATAQAIVNQPAALSVFIQNQEPLTCLSPAIVTIGVGGGTPGYSYLWSTGSTDPTSEIYLENIPASVTVTDQNNCTAIFIINSIPTDINLPLAMAMGGTLTCVQPTITLSSQGSSDGSCFEYSWSGPNNFQSFQMNPSVNLPGTYILTVTNTCNGCMATAQTVVLEDKTLPIFTISNPTDSLHCTNPVVEIGIPLGGGFTLLWTTINGQIEYGVDSNIVGVSLPGLYTVTVTDPNNGCTQSASVMVYAYPNPSIVIDSIEGTTCFGGADGFASVSGTSGLSPYAFLWPDSSTNEQRNDLVAGTYLVSLTDQNGCLAVDTVTIDQPSQIHLIITKTDETGPDANDGTATLSPSGGTPPYTHLWSNDSTTLTISGLDPGTYHVTTTDAVGCTKTGSVTIQPFGCSLAVSSEIIHVNCPGDSTGNIYLSITNATGPLTILWNTGDQGDTLSNIPAGIYNVMISDSIGCGVELEIEVTEISEPIDMVVDSLWIPLVGSMNGAIFITPFGGTLPYTFEWYDDAGVLVSSTEDLLNVMEGNFTLIITDSLGCSGNFIFQLHAASTKPEWLPEVRYYPNPVSDRLTVELPANGIYQLFLVSQQGQSIYQFENRQGVEQMEMGDLPSGWYLLRIIDEKGRQATIPIQK